MQLELECSREIKARIATPKATFNREKTLFTSKLDLELGKKLVKHYIWSIALYGRRKANWIGHILCRKCLLKLIIEGKIRGTIRRGRKRKQVLDDLEEARRHWKMKEEAQDRTLWRTQFGIGYGPVARQTTT
jgi:hypothetical protein